MLTAPLIPSALLFVGVIDLPESASEEMLEDDDFLKKVSERYTTCTHYDVRCCKLARQQCLHACQQAA